VQTAATDDCRGIRNPHRSSRRRGCRQNADLGERRQAAASGGRHATCGQ